MKKEVKQKWVNALRSGAYKQCKEFLKLPEDLTPRGSNFKHMCVLGVLCDIYEQETGNKSEAMANDDDVPEAEILEWAELDSDTAYDLMDANDSCGRGGGKTFKGLASTIEKL